jgi:signal transduction histidine kinase/CheY-like chemotaxis protein
MPTLDSLAARVVPLKAETPGHEVYDRFLREPETLVLPVLEGERPVGLIDRNTFMTWMAAPDGRAQFANSPISALMDDEPVVVDGATRVTTFCDSVFGDGGASLLRGFIVTDRGHYLGVVTVLSLLQATSAHSRERADALDEAQRQAEASARAKSQFLAVMAHEIRTPMNGVLAVAELLQRQPLGPDARAYVQTIIDSSETLLRMLSDALDLSRAQSGALELTSRPGFVRELMDDVQSLWGPRAAQDGVSLLVSYDGDPYLAANYDDVRLKQVFNNLVGNALQFARNGVVEASLKATVEGDQVRLSGSVRDTGPGIPADKIATLFEPFAFEAGADGPGLGLAICRQIVEAMGGRIWAETNAGKGSTFVFEVRLDATDLQRPSESNVSELTDLQLQAEPHVLIVDDNATNRVVAQALCEMFGCTSECAEDGLEALEAVKSRRFDLILMDIKMPRMDGMQATTAIRALPGPAGQTPIVALTANADPEDAKHYATLGMCAVVEKPIKPERLRAAMNAALLAAEAVEETTTLSRTA